MELCKLEIKILIDIYNNETSAKKAINLMNYELTKLDPRKKEKEFAFYLSELKKMNLVTYDEDKAFSCGGCRSPIYNNNVLIVWGENIHISPIGIKLVEDTKKSTVKKSKEKGNDISKVQSEVSKDGFNELLVKNLVGYLNTINGEN